MHSSYVRVPQSTEEEWPALAHVIEHELPLVCDTVRTSGMVDLKHRGHGLHVTLVKRMAMPMRASASIGKVLVRVHAPMWLFNRLKELLSASQSFQDGVPLPAKTIIHWSHIMDKLAARTGLVQAVRVTSQVHCSPDLGAHAWAGHRPTKRLHGRGIA